jgi:endonuclease VIII-like 1
MPEGPEIRIMSDFINHTVEKRKFKSAFHVKKGNQPILFDEENLEDFTISSDFYGKKLILLLENQNIKIPIYIFMGMSGSWKWVDSNTWNDTKYVRMRFDSEDGYSLLLYGGYLGPKYSLYNNFKGSNSGYDMIKEFDNFKLDILNNLENKLFNQPIYELLLDQRYFNGVGNYLRSTILYYADINPFENAKDVIIENPKFLELCRNILEESYQKNGGQLKDWSNPFEKESTQFDEWVYYQKGYSKKDKNGRTFWYHPKWA